MTLDDFLKHWREKYPQPGTLHQDLSPRFYSGKGTFYLPVRCPYCEGRGKGPDKAHHCYAHYEGEWFKCQRCGEKGSLNYLLGIWKKTEKKKEPVWDSYISTPEKQVTDPGLLARSKGLEGSRMKPGTTVRIEDLPTTHVAWQYLLSEGFKNQDILSLAEEYGIFYCLQGHQITQNPLNNTTHRLIFEIQEGGKCYGWQARWLPSSWPPSAEDAAMEKEVEKYLFSPGIKKSFILYNWDIAQAWDMWILVEGIKKVWKTGRFALAGFGVGNNPHPPEETSEAARNQFWSIRLKNGKRPVGLLYDKDALSVAMSHAEQLRAMGVDATAIPHPITGHKDLDKYHPLEIRKIIKTTMGRLPKIL